MRQPFLIKLFLCSCSLFCAVLIGCGSGELEFQQTAVQGTVTFKGKPLETGQIQFIPDAVMKNGQVAGKMAFANIKDGNYSIPGDRGATVGKNRVEIVSYRATGKTTQVENSVTDVEVQVVPEKYNTSSTLSVEVKPGENSLDFNLD